MEQPIERALLLGDGDGRLALEILKKYPKCRIVSIDLSPGMQAKAKQRVEAHFGKLPWNYNLTCADARKCAFKPEGFDYIGLHFFLDCFNDADCAALVENCITSLASGGTLSYADFHIPAKQPMRAISWLLIKALYLCFRLTADLKTQRLPKLVWPRELNLNTNQHLLGGMLQCSIYTKAGKVSALDPVEAPSPRLKRLQRSKSSTPPHPSWT